MFSGFVKFCGLVIKGKKMAEEITGETFGKEVLQSQIPVLVDFWAPWCGPCRMVAPSIEAISKKYQGRLKVVKVNVDNNQQVAAQYGIMSIPTLMVFKDGKQVEQLVGALPQAAMEDKLKKYI